MEDHEYIIDSEASLHNMGGHSLTPAELKTVASSSDLCVMVTANGTVQTDEEATVYDYPEVLPLGMFCETMGFAHSWKAGEQPSLIKGGSHLKLQIPETLSQLSP